MTGGCIVGGVVSGAIQGINNCLAAGGKVNTPWGQKQVHWGMLTAVRDSNGAEQLRLLGNSMPLWKIGWSHNIQYKRVSVYGLVDKVFGNKVYNEDRHWSFGDYMTQDAQQNGKTVENKQSRLATTGVHQRRRAPQASVATTTLLGPNNISFEDAGYIKVREFSRCRTTSARSSISPALGASRRLVATYTRGPSTGLGSRFGDGGGQLGPARSSPRSRPATHRPGISRSRSVPSSNPPARTGAPRASSAGAQDRHLGENEGDSHIRLGRAAARSDGL